MQKIKSKKNILCLLSCFIVLLLACILLFYQKPVAVDHIRMEFPFGYSTQMESGVCRILKYGTEIGGIQIYHDLSNEEITQLSTSRTLQLPDSEVVPRFLTENSRQKYVDAGTRVLCSSLYGDFQVSLEDLDHSQNEEHYFFCEPMERTLVDVWFFMDGISDQKMHSILASVQFA